MNTIPFTYRREVRKDDPQHIEEIVRSTGFFREDEIIVARELAEERLLKGPASGYEFIFADVKDKPIAYSCFGLIACTLVSYDLYWIATHQDFRNQGIGKLLLAETEREIARAGGKGIYVETSSLEKYISTRTFYERNLYQLKAQFEDFYDVGDHKVVYVKYLK
jgi:D-alanine-D-alanine ligase